MPVFLFLYSFMVLVYFYYIIIRFYHFSTARRSTAHWAAEISKVSHRLVQLEILSDNVGRSELILLALQAANLAEVAGNKQDLADTYVTAALIFKDYVPKIGNWLCRYFFLATNASLARVRYLNF